MRFHSTRAVPVATDVYATLRHEIVTAQLKPGQALSEVGTAARFGTSRTPVRESFQRLVADGLLRIQPQVGTFVAPIGLDAVHDSQFVREALECAAVALAAARATEGDAALLHGLLREQERLVASAELGGFMAADDGFHAELLRIGGRPVVWTLIRDAKAQLDRVRYLSLHDPDWLRAMLAQHAGITAAVVAGDAAGAEAAMRAHLRTVLAAVERIGAWQPRDLNQTKQEGTTMNDTQPSRRQVTGGLATILALGAAPPVLAAGATTLKLGHLANEDNSWHKASLKFAEEVEKRTDGQFKVQVFPNEQLGKETDLIKGIQLGTVDFTITGESLQNWTPAAALLAVPYAVRDIAQLDRVVSGSIGHRIAEAIEQKAQLRPLCYFARGPRELTSNRPIKSPDELDGLKLRVPNVPLFVKFWGALGAKPTPMAFSEVFTSLQNHTIDAQENPLALIKSASFYEVQKYVNLTDHVISWIYLVGGTRRLGRMTQAQQDAIKQAAEVAQAYERTLFRADEKKFADDLKSRGMEFIEVDKAAFASKGKAAVATALNPEVRPLYEEILAVA